MNVNSEAPPSHINAYLTRRPPPHPFFLTHFKGNQSVNLAYHRDKPPLDFLPKDV